ncbi:hypothetical protein MMC29_001126 [Sticta canariensis]|nr:hypothetical protein [Sticta canariensis]
MALPPEHITIKRRRDDEPVDTLYIQQKRQRPDYRWCRVDSGETSTIGITPLLQPLLPSKSEAARPHYDARASVPVVRATSPSIDETNELDSDTRPLPSHQKHVRDATPKSQVKTVSPKPSPPSSVVHSRLKRRHSSKHLFRPRTFHLSSSLASSSTPVTSISGTLKLKKHRKHLAVFMERTKRVPQDQDTLRRTTIAHSRLAQTGDEKQRGDDLASGSRGIPITGSIDKEGRFDGSIKLAETVVNPSTRALNFNQSSGEGDLDAKIAEQLHQTVSHQSLISMQCPEATCYEPQPKIKPKPPKPRHMVKNLESGGSGGNDFADGMISPENEDDFVYDTYVRSLGQPAGIAIDISEPYDDESHLVDNSKIGILVIPEHDQAIWETFGEEEESDKDWNSEEEDENAEDFYGNDYPEDEVNSDDEFGMGAYDYRHRASDDEEFDEVAGRSDEDGAEQDPWQRSGWRVLVQDSANHKDPDD